MRVAQLQTQVDPDVMKNIEEADRLMTELDGKRPDLVTLGEMFACPYETANFPRYAERRGGVTWQALSELARRHHVLLSAGTVPELDEEGNVYNTAYVFDRDGREIGHYRKMHLFDVDIPGGQVFHESETLTPGNEVVTFDTEFGRMGICICFDMRFPELFRLIALEGARLVLVPAAFNMSTGPAHWALLHRSNALANQVFVVATSDARDMTASYHAWGHSMLVDPWGRVRGELDEKPGVLFTDIDMTEVDRDRQAIPTLTARRTDIYRLSRLV
ncbi:MAG: carbon-nitrogen hydrolase family protein [Lachnospiraceae bacterium]|nr:carbon-nitrogen hydrolase family protein [Lachnospiraceae bacterium]